MAKFKVGDNIEQIINKNVTGTVIGFEEGFYRVDFINKLTDGTPVLAPGQLYATFALNRYYKLAKSGLDIILETLD